MAAPQIGAEATFDWENANFNGSAAEVEALVRLYDRIELTSDQEAVRVAALSDLPAPCCSDFSAATCCCECNLSRSIWGLSKYLIAEAGADAAQVRSAVERWVATINPNSYSGRVCSTGRCGLPFRADGCGGMSPHQIVH